LDNKTGGFSFKKPMNEDSDIKKVIAVMSGKGGVGKSSVTSLMAITLKDAGYKVGILDADVTGPSIVKVFGLSGQRAMATERGAMPLTTKGGIKVISIQALLENEEQAAIWRGPMISGVIEQFWTDVIWGDLDYLLLDLPPGTADVPLTVMQSIVPDGIVMVTTPQELVELIVKKSVNMAKIMKTRIFGIIENMSYMVCSHCGNKMAPFGESRIDSIAEGLELDVLGKLPIDPEFVRAADRGEVEEYKGELKTVLKGIQEKL
jgi:ATP-binding protein involved in chromosome partitioning